MFQTLILLLTLDFLAGENDRLLLLGDACFCRPLSGRFQISEDLTVGGTLSTREFWLFERMTFGLLWYLLSAAKATMSIKPVTPNAVYTQIAGLDVPYDGTH